MTDATAAFYNVPSLDGRGLPLGNYRRVLNGVLVGLGTVAAVCVLVTTVTVAAAWIINTVLATNPYIRAHAPMGSGTLALAKMAALDVAGAASVSTALADDPEVTFEASWPSPNTDRLWLAPWMCPGRRRFRPLPSTLRML